MPKKQQNKPNGFLLYANEIKNQLLKEGHNIRTTPDLIHSASPKWQALSQDDRDYYKEKAKWQWENRHTTGKYQSRQPHNYTDKSGAPVSDHVDLARINEIRREKERQEVFMSFRPGRGVLDQKFYFVSFICLLEDPAYQPIEIAAAEFSLLHGRERTWHKHIHPGAIPQGFRFKAQQNSELTHKLPLEGKMDPRDNYTKIYDELFQFLSKGTRHIPPIHVKISEGERVEECLKWLALNAGRPNHLKRVYELEGLMLDLEAHLRGDPQNLMQMKQPATDILSSSIFDWDKDSRCEYHEDEDNETDTNHCALGHVNRYCFCLADYFCTNHDINITDNHLPPKQNDICYTIVPSKDVIKQQQKQRQQQRSQRSTSGWNTPSSTNSSGIDDLAQRVSAKLRLEEENRQRNQQQIDDDEANSRQKEEEQKKRWIALRGSPNKGSPNRESHDIGSPNKQQDQQQDEYVHPPFGRGRGRGRGVTALNNLRRPGEKAPSVSNEDIKAPPPGFGPGNVQNNAPFRMMGRGTMLHSQQQKQQHTDEQQNINGDRWAGPPQAPCASDAPRPPRAWMS